MVSLGLMESSFPPVAALQAEAVLQYRFESAPLMSRVAVVPIPL